MNEVLDFRGFLRYCDEQGGLRTDDVIAVVMPLLEALHGVHVEGRVARLRNADAVRVEEGRLYLDLGSTSGPISNARFLFTKPRQEGPVVVTREVTEVDDEDHRLYRNALIRAEGEALSAPKYVVGYAAWDLEVGHHDPITDIHICGLILASLAFGLDFNDPEDLDAFVERRDNLFAINDQVHPTLVSVIRECTQLYREDRPRSLDEVIAKLKNFRQYDPDNYVDLTHTAGFRQQDLSSRDNWILAKLKARLFDLSRRNKLLYFRDTEGFVNLTVASVPPLLDHKNIDPDSLITWSRSVRDKVIGKKRLVLTGYLDMKERPTLPARLDKVRSEARKAVNEYGVDPLRLVIAFLRWTNFKDYGNEKISTPLLLLPVELVKRKGVKDQYVLECPTVEAEVNPVLVHYFREIYGIELPDMIDLEASSVEDLVSSIRQQAKSSGSEIELDLVEKPRIELVHAAARQAFSRTLRRTRRHASGLDPRSFSYSYGTEGFTPLGLQLYQRKVRPAASTFEYIINEDIRPGVDHAKGNGGRSFYNTVEEGDANPYNWEVDLCNVTLGNFNARRMSLVRDYDHIIEANAKDEVFNMLFSDQPRPLQEQAPTRAPLAERFPIIQADPTQTRAIEQAAGGGSYIIQGPPGTGKSQTITNLIAYYVGAGKKVLFVCEKRAALDVVFHRLKQRELDEVCCRVHDSQADKKSFIQDLKLTYEVFLKSTMDEASIARERASVIGRMEEEIGRLEHFHRRMRESQASIGIPLHTLLDRLIAQRDEGLHEADAIVLERIPDHAAWLSVERLVRELSIALKELGRSPIPAEHPLIAVQAQLLNDEQPLGRIIEVWEKAAPVWERISEQLDAIDLPPGMSPTLGELIMLAGGARQLGPVAERDKLGIFDNGHEDARQYDVDVEAIERQKKSVAMAAKATVHWKQKPSALDAQAVREQWQRVNKGFFKFLNGTYRRIKAMVVNSYDLSKHQVAPDIARLLDDLCAEHEAQEKLAAMEQGMHERYGMEDNALNRELVRALRDRQRDAKWNALFAMTSSEIAELVDLGTDLDRFTAQARMLNAYCDELALNGVDRWMQDVKAALNGYSGLMPYLREIAALEPRLHAFITKQRISDDAMAYLTAYKSLREVYRNDRLFDRLDGLAILHSVKQLNALEKCYLDANVDMIRSSVRTRFKQHVRISDTSVTGMGPDERAIKKEWTVGRRILENEFGKSMRYKSVRELIGKESGPVVMGLKPVWLMSPQSVSDILPLDTKLFDVVIYDEASQITLEEGVPALFRTGQTIIVGDEMQMPPTNFFNTTSGDVDEEEDATEERIGIALDADSLLSQGVRKLPSVMLGWHYRSRHESLISFSNAAFYGRGLLTIPDQQLLQAQQGPISVADPADAVQHASALSDRPISFHHVRNGVYHERRNDQEARYIALLIQQLLGQGRSIGVVAFSIEQQSAIEEALQELAAVDKVFEARLEEEYQRVEDDQFVGLFIKNLENVQGDERDVIIMSVCYAPNANGRMLMNFGPINRRGGEKRLNVIFSRAKRHMAVVSSITANDIKNEHNEGANYLRRFLQYAERLSAGEKDGAATVLDSLSLRSAEHSSDQVAAVTVRIAERLQAQGHHVDRNVGSSYFRCDLAVRASDGKGYRLGILIDSDVHYRNDDVLEQYCQRPALLRAFGWEVITILAKDWFKDPDQAMARLERVLAGDEEAAPEIIVEPLPLPGPEPVAVGSGTSEHSPSTIEPLTEPIVAANDQAFERYECVEDGSSKFWEVKVEGAAYTVRYGRIGTAGQSLTKQFADETNARREMEKVRAKKVEKGYRRV
jgi:predicted DNA-binding WGR domain protein